MAQVEDRALTDDELMTVFKNPKADLSLLTREERNRLLVLTDPATMGPPPTPPKNMLGQSMNLPPDVQAQWEALQARKRGEAPPIGDQLIANIHNLATGAVNALPMVGGMMGGAMGMAGGPVGSVAGAAFGGAGGEGLRQSIRTLTGQDIPRTAGQAVAGLGGQAAFQGGAQALGLGVEKAVPTLAAKVYRGYLKPSLAARNIGKAEGIVNTALDEALPISKAGVQSAQNVISELRGQVDQILADSEGTIDLQDVANKVRDFAKARYYKPGVDEADFQMAMNVANKIDQHASLGLTGKAAKLADVSPGSQALGQVMDVTHPGETAPRINPAGHGTGPALTPEELAAARLKMQAQSATTVPLSQANEIKRGLYTSIKEAGFGTPQGAKKTTEKFAAHELRTALEQAAPAIAPLNARETKLIDAARAISRAVEREANQNKLYGVKTMMSVLGGTTTAAATGNPLLGTAVGMGGRRLLEPDAASHLTLLAYRIAKELGVGISTAGRLAGYVLTNPEQSGSQVGSQDVNGEQR